MKKIYPFLILFIVLSMSCTDKFEDYNTDIRNPNKAEGEFFFSQAQKELCDQISSTNVNWNIFKLVSQYWNETTYLDEANYDLINRNIPEQIFTAYYRYVLKPLNEAKVLITEDPLTPIETEQQKLNKLMIIEILEVYAYNNLVCIFGGVPYSEAMDIENVTPKYDSDIDIFNDLISRLDKATSSLDPSEQSFVDEDIYLGGDVSKWVKFANSLKLKIAIQLADAGDKVSFTPQVVAEQAIEAGVITSADDNVLLEYLSGTPNTNPLYEELVMSGRKDFVPANTIVDIMNKYNDPRMGQYFTSIDTSDNDIDDPVYYGGKYGFSSSYSNHSHLNPRLEDPTFPGILMSYTEIQFYIAEAAARGWSVGSTAEEAYNKGVTASFLFWKATKEQASTYLEAQSFSSYDTWQEAIATQSWLANYTRGLVAFNTYRRLDFPKMNTPDPDLVRTDDSSVPRRFTYPVNEQTLNPKNYEAAAEAIGGDDMLTRLFWDIADPQ